MDREYIIKLTLALYRVTELFPEKEPLKDKLRERALKILGDLAPYYFSSDSSILDSRKSEIDKTAKDIEALEDLLEIAQSQNWVDFRNFLVLNQEYVNIRKGLIYASLDANSTGIIQEKDKLIEKKSKELPKKAKISPRQEKILEFLKKQEKAQVWELQKFFPEKTKRTLRRDLENLLSQGLIERIGKWNETFYKIKSV
ncbi:DeoR family transcriptional regulator [Candidatus Parcubacteria bacterium]|nr:DeoR family transcriptional regulator [Candidatus Parcubacteria bacterium]